MTHYPGVFRFRQTLLPFVSTSLFSLLIMCTGTSLLAQKPPSVHPSVSKGEHGFQIKLGGQNIQEYQTVPLYTLNQMKGNPKGNSTGILFDFRNPEFTGTLHFGFIPYGDSKHPTPVFFKSPSEILSGKAFINIKDQLSGRYDMVSWEKNQKGTLGYRVMDVNGNIIYDGIVSFTGNGPFKVVPTIIEGPFVNLLGHTSATLSFETSEKVKTIVKIAGQEVTDPKAVMHHEVHIEGLAPAKTYPYTIVCEDHEVSYELTTAPAPGTRSAFTFAYASDSRSGKGGGERDIYGANAYIMKKIMALARQQRVAFFQFSGDMINGYLTSPEEMDLQYANWKRAIEPFAHYFPVYISMGNHEALMRQFVSDDQKIVVRLDRFPYDTESAEAVFGRNFVNPTNGPESEDGSKYDPDPKKTDFPSYRENVFYYTYDNAAVIVLNSDYWYSPSTGTIPYAGGGLHGYIMDQQLEWLRKTVDELEKNPNIDHVFITQHTPAFPNGGHTGDDMWYNGNNKYRPRVGFADMEKGILERRDEYLDIIVNKSSKVIAIFTGDEHNYARTTIDGTTSIYPDAYEGEKLTITRKIYQINNGAAGAPYYAQEETPWTPKVEGFTTQNALVLITVSGNSVKMKVLNPDTLEEVDQLTLR